MRVVWSLLAFSLAFHPVTARAGLRDLLDEKPSLEHVQKPTVVDCAEGYKCLDFENYKLYLQMRLQYGWLFKFYNEGFFKLAENLETMNRAYAEGENVQAERALRAEEAYDALFPKYEASVLRAERAKALSILGGGLPWVVVVGVACLAGGLLIGLNL